VSGEEREGFVHDTVVDEHGIVGARWWNRALTDQAAAMTRRAAIGKALVGITAVAAVAGIGVAIYESSGPDYDSRIEPSLDAQRRYGWNLGARDHALAYRPDEALALPSVALPSLRADLAPIFWPHAHVSTMFEAPDAVPSETLAEETVSFRPMREELRAAVPASARVAEAVGASLARLFLGVPAQAGLVLDLPGQDAVGFAAGAAQLFEPVSGIGNWPHPLGVVAVHEVLAAAAAYQPTFQAARAQRGANPPPCFILDRQRLIEPVGADRFDNRYLAQLPTAATLRAGGVTRLLYVVPTGGHLPELDDLNADMVDLVRAGIEVRALALAAFQLLADGAYYGTQATHAGFWSHYAWGPGGYAGEAPPVDPIPRTWQPALRATRFSRASAPSGFGRVELVVANDAVLGAAFDRRGSWNRTSGGYGGG
jgi:hypothetical protein